MANENNNERKRRVFRQSWKMGPGLKLLHSAWMAIYSVIKVALAALATVLIIGAVCVVVFVGLLGEYLEGNIMPQAGVQVESFGLKQNSYVYYYDSEGNIQVLQRLYAVTDSEWATIDEIPEDLIHAAVSIEDKRFYEHQGVDWFTTVKACINMFVGSGDQFGGSSITQQLIKNILLLEDTSADDVTVQRKMLEIFRATEFERRYDKDIIMEYYLNYIYLGSRCTGVKSAAAKYFGKELEDLTTAECAALISITNNPSRFNPYRTNLDNEGKTGLEQNKERMTNTLWMMRNEGWITEEEYQEALAQEIVLKDGIDPEDRYGDCNNETCGYHGKVGTFIKKSDGIYYCPQCNRATKVGEDASQEVYSWFVDVVLEDVAQAMAERDHVDWNDKTKEVYKNLISQGGYHIYSTMDYNVQQSVDKIYKDLKQIPETKSVQQLQSAIVIIDNSTGDIVALSGGVGDNKGFDDWNRATDAKLQPGSSIKPLTIYAPAFELGVITPSTVITDLPIRYTEVIKEEEETLPEGEEETLPEEEEEPELNPFPKNEDKKYSYSKTILTGLVESINGVAVNTLDKIGLTYSFNYAKEQFGLSTLTERYVNSAGTVFSDVDWSPLAMGAPTIGVTVRDMANAYSAFPNSGVYRTARTFTKVLNSDGKLVLSKEQQSRTVISEKALNYLNFCLDQAVQSGTGTPADLSGQDVAGKTGTTASKKDRWFCGYTEYYTAAVWCGYDLPEEIKMTGRNPAAQLYKKVMQPVHNGLPRKALYDGSEFVTVNVCLDSGKLATDACYKDARCDVISRVVSSKVMQEDMPTEKCDKHVLVDFCSSCNCVATQYCRNFAAVGETTIVKKSMVKLTQEEVDEIALACEHGLNAVYLRNDYVYLVDGNGDPASFHGMDGLANEGIDEPYVICTVHTKQAWQDYVNSRND